MTLASDLGSNWKFRLRPFPLHSSTLEVCSIALDLLNQYFLVCFQVVRPKSENRNIVDYPRKNYRSQSWRVARYFRARHAYWPSLPLWLTGASTALRPYAQFFFYQFDFPKERKIAAIHMLLYIRLLVGEDNSQPSRASPSRFGPASIYIATDGEQATDDPQRLGPI